MREGDDLGRGGWRRALSETPLPLLPFFKSCPLSTSHPCCFPAALLIQGLILNITEQRIALSYEHLLYVLLAGLAVNS